MLSNEDFSIGETITFFFKESGLFELYAKEDGGFSDREENIKALIDLSARYGRGRDGLRLFLDSLALDTSFDTKEKRSGVNLATIHNTKGLEFDRVFITGLEDGILPSARTENIEEERRLFYVAVTRARHALYITSAASRFRFGRSERQMPSPFLAELDKEAVDVFGRRTDEEELLNMKNTDRDGCCEACVSDRRRSCISCLPTELSGRFCRSTLDWS